jgi:hypothetical protein
LEGQGGDLDFKWIVANNDQKPHPAAKNAARMVHPAITRIHEKAKAASFSLTADG